MEVVWVAVDVIDQVDPAVIKAFVDHADARVDRQGSGTDVESFRADSGDKLEDAPFPGHQDVDTLVSEYLVKSFGAEQKNLLQIKRHLNLTADLVKALDVVVKNPVAVLEDFFLCGNLGVQGVELCCPFPQFVAIFADQVAKNSKHNCRAGPHVAVQGKVFGVSRDVAEHLGDKRFVVIQKKDDPDNDPADRRADAQKKSRYGID